MASGAPTGSPGDMDTVVAIDGVTKTFGRVVGKLGDKDPSVVALTGTYHNLLRRWADA